MMTDQENFAALLSSDQPGLRMMPPMGGGSSGVKSVNGLKFNERRFVRSLLPSAITFKE